MVWSYSSQLSLACQGLASISAHHLLNTRKKYPPWYIPLEVIDDSWPFPRSGAEGFPLREQEYFQAYLLLVCSELDQEPNWTRNLVLEQDFYTREQSAFPTSIVVFALPFSSVKLTNLNENLTLQIVKNWDANVLLWFKVTVKSQVVPDFRRMSTSFFSKELHYFYITTWCTEITCKNNCPELMVYRTSTTYIEGVIRQIE